MVVALMLLTGLISTSGSAAQGAPVLDPGAGSATTPSKVTYQGRLTNEFGEPLTGAFNFKFQVYDDEFAGIQYGTDTKFLVIGSPFFIGLCQAICSACHQVADGWLG